MRRGEAARGVGACGLALLALSAVAANARALEPTIQSHGPHLMHPGKVPSGGGLLLTKDAIAGYGVIVSPLEDEARALPGRIDFVAEHAVWRAEEPLPIGEYWVQVGSEHLAAPSVYVIEVVEPIEGPPRLVVEPSLSIKSKSIDSACCDQWREGELHRGVDCFSTAYHDSVVLDPGLRTPEPSYVISQYVFQLRGTEPQLIVERAAPWGALPPLEFDLEAERYCFSLEAIHIVSGARHPLADNVACVEHGELPALMTREVEPTSQALEASHCHAPPPEHQPAWCEVNDAFCEANRGRIQDTGCPLYAFVCEDAPFPGTSGDFFFPRARDAAVEEPDEDMEVVDPEPTARASGCSAGGGPDGRSQLPAALLGLLALSIARRRIAFARKLAMLAGVSNRGAAGCRRLAACAALVLAACGEAGAVQVPTQVTVEPDLSRVVPLRSIPSNGALPLGVFEVPPVVTVWANEWARQLEGEVREVAGYYAWVPSETLDQGTLHVALTVFSVGGALRTPLDYPIEVVGPYARRAPGLVSEPSASLHSTPLESVCCRTWDGTQAVPTFCTATSYQDRVLLGPGLISADPDIALRQHAFAVYRALPDERQLVGVGLWQEWPEIIFEDQADEYCFEIEATDFSTGRRYEYRNLTPRCAEHGALPDLERHDADLTDDALDRALCEIPPDGYEERWCALNDAACQKAPDAQGCALDDFICHGGAPPTPTGAAGAGSALLGADEEPQVVVVGSRPAECSAALGAARARPAWLPLLALLGVKWLRPRRRRACGSSST